MFRNDLKAKGGREAWTKGFTLIELMITLVILGLVLGVVYRMFSSQERFFRTQEQVASMQENLRSTVEYMNQELSWLGYRVPGVAVLKASPNDLIFKANIPNTGASIQYVRYRFDTTAHTIFRAAGQYPSDVNAADVVMANDIEALSFSFYTAQNNVILTNPADPLCSDELSAAACAPAAPATVDEQSLLMIHRVKARVTARTSQPDWQYTDPAGGPSPNFRKRSAVLDMKARNVEDVTIIAGQLSSGTCGVMTHTLTPPSGGVYNACRDKVSMLATGVPDMSNGWSDNPSLTITAYNMSGGINTNEDMIAIVYAVGSDSEKTPFNVYDPADPLHVDNTLDTGETRYITAQQLSNVGQGNRVIIQFAYSDGICTQVLYEGNSTFLIGPDAPSRFDTTGAYADAGLAVSYVDLETGDDLSLGSPAQVAMCSTASNQGIALEVRILDECDNPIAGESISWSDGGAGGSFINESDNGDGTYSVTYVPPAAMAPTSAPTHTVTLTAQWSGIPVASIQTLVAAQPDDIIIDGITDVLNAGIFQFTSTVEDSGSSFAIERIDGQNIGIRFHLEDACGNRVFGQGSNVTLSTTTGTFPYPLVSNPDGSYYFEWEWLGGCGLEKLDENITISVSTISNPSTQNEVIAFDLLTTRSSPDVSGPFVVMDRIDLTAPTDGLLAGNTSDSVQIEARVTEYHPEMEYCSNIPGVFPVDFTVAGGPGGNGSFNAVSPFNLATSAVNTDAAGVARVRLYSGTADWDDLLSITAAANVAGEVYEGTIDAYMAETNHPQVSSGIYGSGTYLTQIGEGKAVTTFNPGSDLHIQIYDCDENEDPLAFDSQAFPFTFVTVRSDLLGDEETLNLGELAGTSANSCYFRAAQETRFATAGVVDDGILQVRDGDTVTVYYEDKDTPADNDTWTVFTPGADSFRVYKVEADGSETLLANPGPAQTATVVYGSHVRPALSLPFLAGDVRSAEDTVNITVDSGADMDTVVLRERGDTGVLVPDWTIYANDFITMAQEDLADASHILLTPTTPRYVTLTYDAAGSYSRSALFFMRDYDPPEVAIIAPADGATVSGAVTVLVEAVDEANATTWAGISRVDLYVNGRFIATTATESSPGVYSFTWITAFGAIPYWLDGSHTLTARAVDNSGNEAWSAPVGVTVDNNLSPIWFTEPAYNSIWSADVTIGIGASMAAEAGTYEVFLLESGGMGAALASWTGVGESTFTYNCDTTTLPEGANDLVATIRDLGSLEYTTTALRIVADRTEPVIAIGPPFDQEWINIADFPMTVSATVSDPRVDPADPNDVDDSSVTGTFSGICSSSPAVMTPAGPDTYTLFRDLSLCGEAEGLLTFTVEADDVASPPNHASEAETAMVDTRRPTVDTFDVLPWVNQPFTMGSVALDGFFRGDVTLSATVTDGWPDLGAFFGRFYNDPYVWSGVPDGTEYMLPPGPPLDASSGSFSTPWATGTYPEGIYALFVGVMDAAGNSNDASPRKILYLDNSQPWSDLWVNPPSGVYRDLVYLQTWANDNAGFLREVHFRIVETATSLTAWEETVGFPLVEAVRQYQMIDVLDLSSWSQGSYDCETTAVDWAGNTHTNIWSGCFEIPPFVELDEDNPVPCQVVFSEISTGQYSALVRGGTLEDGAGWGIPGEDIWVDVYRYTWEPSGYNWEQGEYPTVTTNFAGELPDAGVSLVFGETDMAEVNYYLAGAFQWLGTLHAYLGSPMDGAADWSNTFEEPFSSMVDNLDFVMTPSGTDHFTLEITGNLLRSSGDPAAVVDMRIRVFYYEDPPGIWTSQDFTDQTSPFGDFAFSLPLLLPYEEWVDIDFYDDRDVHLGWAEWNPVTGTWQRWFW